MHVEIDEYLAPITVDWCHSTLAHLGFPGGVVNGRDVDATGSKLHLQAYLLLRDAIVEHVLRGNQPHLNETVKPYHARDWRPAAAVEQELNAGGMDIITPQDDPDPWLRDWLQEGSQVE